ncbi:hypothetical protein GCM10022205_35390 [Spinactinospora alkalitolerans]
MTERIERASRQPKRIGKPDETAYPAGPGRDHDADQEKVRVVVPDEPPPLTPEAARALLRIIRKAYAQRSAPEQHTPHSIEDGDD